MTQENITPEEHSDIVGGSSAARVLACPGSVRLNQDVKRAHMERILETLKETHGLSPSLTIDQLPDPVMKDVIEVYEDDTTSSYAAEGTGLHEAVAWVLENDEELESIVDREFVGVHITPTLYSEAIIPAMDGFDDYLERLYEEDGEDAEFLVEKRGELPQIPGAFGTSDVAGKTSKRVFIWDWKFGAGVAVSPEKNSQFMFYGRALMHTHKEWFADLLVDGEFPPDLQIDLIVSQPRIGDGQPQIWSTTFAALIAFENELKNAVENAMSEDPRFKQGGHCRWCDAKNVCPAKNKLGQRILERINAAVDAQPGDDTELDIKKAVKEHDVQFTPEDLADWLEDVKEIEVWCSHIKELAHREAREGRPPAGMELDQGYGNTSWAVDEKTVDRRLASYGLTVDQRRSVKAISPTQARKLVKAVGDVKHQQLLEKIIERPKGALKLVPIGSAKEPVDALPEKMEAVGKKLKQLSDD